MNIKYAALCDKGLKRPNNEDRITSHIGSDVSIFAVADGMGGHSEGEYASERLIEALDLLWNELCNFKGDFQSMIDRVILALENINDRILEYASTKKIICGSTVSILLICGRLFAVINVGDSPVYYYASGKLVHASTEHNFGTIMRKTALINPENIDARRKNKLVQAIGVKKSIYPSVRTGAVSGESVFMLCSDGISRYFTDKRIKDRLRRIRSGRLAEFTDYCRTEVYKKGAVDNLSLIIVYAENDNPKNKT